MKEHVLDILACPDCKAVLSLSQSKDTLICENSAHQFPVIDNIPVLFPTFQSEISKDNIIKIPNRSKKNGISWAQSHWDNCKLGDLLGYGTNRGILLSFGCANADENDLIKKSGFIPVSFDIYPASQTDLLADGHYLPFLDKSFDAITSFEVLEHLKNPWEAIKEISRVLKPGGLFIGSVAFLKPYHNSYFHMTYKGVESLLDEVNIEVDRIFGCQNIFLHVVGRFIPLWPRKLTVTFYNTINKIISRTRRTAMRLKTGRDPAASTALYDPKYRSSFDEYQTLLYGASIVFKAHKRQ